MVHGSKIIMDQHQTNISSGEEPFSLWGTLRTTFARGLGVTVPVVITVWVLNGLFNAVDGIISPVLVRIIGQHIPGLGFISMIVLILLIGILSRNLVGKVVFKFFERIIFAIPLARTIYSAMKDLIGAFALGSKGKTFREVVLVEYPRIGLFSIGFVTNQLTINGIDPALGEMVSVYFPHPPNPTSGVMIAVPRSSVRTLAISVEEGLKLVLSGGIVLPTTLKIK